MTREAKRTAWLFSCFFTISILHAIKGISIKNYTVSLCHRDFQKHISHLSAHPNKNNKISWERSRKRMQLLRYQYRSRLTWGKWQTSAVLPVSFTKQICLETAVKWLYIWIIHKQLLTQQGPTAQAECMIANSLSHFVSIISTDKIQQRITVGLSTLA